MLPKSRLLVSPAPNARATVLGPSEEFSKKPMYVCSSAMATISTQFTTSHSNTCGAPPKKPKEVPFLTVSALFSTKWLGHRGFQRETWWNQLILQSRRRTENVPEDFWLFVYGLRYRGVSASVSGQNQTNLSVFRGKIWKLGEIPPKTCSAFSIFKCWCRLWLCYQTWPN